MKADQASRTARQVRFDDSYGRVHKVKASWFTQTVGFTYRAYCGTALTAAAGAILTTRDADCPQCRAGRS